MAKKIRDINIGKDQATINLKSRPDQAVTGKVHHIKKRKAVLYKQNTPIKEITDISPENKPHYLYIRGTNFKPPKYLGNLIKMSFLGFIIILIFNSINVYYSGKKLENEIASQAFEGYNFLLDAGKNATKIQFDSALAAFDKALSNFSQARDKLWFISTDNSYYSKNQNVGHSVNALLEGGKYFATAGSYFLEALESFNNLPIYFVSKNIDPDSKNSSLTDALKIGLEKTNLAIEEITNAQIKISGINEKALPQEIALRVSFAKKKIAEVSKTLSSISEHFPALLKLLGDRHPHRYLILLQNNNEIRPTGGFIGSYLIMDLNDGYITRLTTHDVYELDGSYGTIIEPPDELKAFTSNWRFRDSNYSPDFYVSAQKARWFLEKEGGPTVDTVIGINQGLLKDMLEITGPIQVGSFGKLNSENYNLLLSYIIEGKIWGDKDPKHILKIFVPAFKDALLAQANIPKVASKLYKAIQQKHIVFYSSDQEIQELFDSMGISGKVYRSAQDEDYLSVIKSAYGGTKSEQFMEEKITHETAINADGRLINKVTIKRSHLWDDDVYFQWKKILKIYGFNDLPDHIIDILGRGANKVNIRVYVPAGSVLLDSENQKILTKYDKELKKTYFFTTLEVNAGQSKEFTLTYRLPFNLEFNHPASTYKLFVEKQPGTRGSIFTKTISSPENIYELSSFPDAHLDHNGNITFATNLVYDRYFSAIFSKK